MQLLEKLFARHYKNSAAALERFRDHLSQASLSFDVLANLREHNFSPAPGFPDGMPSFIYYYVPGTNFGSSLQSAGRSGESRHVVSSDGIGLNMGCPIRLAHALDILFSLRSIDRDESLSLLRARSNHFAAVEEILWLTVWKQPAEAGRGGELAKRSDGKKSKDVDWFLFSAGLPLYLEAKYRPTDWLRVTDRGDRVVNEQFFKNIGSKFPSEKSVLQLCVAAITGFAEPINRSDGKENSFFALCEKKLLANPGLNALLYRSLLGPIYVCSLDKAVVFELSSRIQFPPSGDYPLSYPVVFNRELREQRARSLSSHQPRLQEQGRVFFAIVPTNQPCPTFDPEFPFRFGVANRSAKGEPQFEQIPPFLESSAKHPPP